MATKLSWTQIKSLPPELKSLEKTYREASKTAGEARSELVEAIRDRLASRADVQESMFDDDELVVTCKFGSFAYAIAPKSKTSKKGIAL